MFSPHLLSFFLYHIREIKRIKNTDFRVSITVFKYLGFLQIINFNITSSLIDFC